MKQSFGKYSDVFYLSCLLSIDTLIAVITAHCIRFYSVGEYMGPALELSKTGRIHSRFLPVGYPALLAAGYRVSPVNGYTVVNISIALLLLASIWIFLRLTGAGIKKTFVLTGLFSLYPDFLLSYNKVQDVNLTALMLVSFLVSVLMIARIRRFGCSDLLLSMTLAGAVIVRPNMLLLLPLAFVLLYRIGIPQLKPRIAAQLIVITICYCAFTAAVHGKPFFPRNGPYNLFSGFNSYTADHLLNNEDSIPTALAAQGIIVRDWRDPNYDPIYLHSALLFIRTHPIRSAELVVLKFYAMMRPDYRVHHANTWAGFAKTLSALAVPLWLIAAFYLPQNREKVILIAGVIFVTILPFVLTVSAQRFREPLDFICWIDLGAVILANRQIFVAEDDILFDGATDSSHSLA